MNTAFANGARRTPMNIPPISQRFLKAIVIMFTERTPAFLIRKALKSLTRRQLTGVCPKTPGDARKKMLDLRALAPGAHENCRIIGTHASPKAEMHVSAAGYAAKRSNYAAAAFIKNAVNHQIMQGNRQAGMVATFARNCPI
jgi:hypothetical protein